MAKGILGKKVGMTQVFDEKGKAIPVTVVEAGPCVVVQKKTENIDGYNAVQLGFTEQKEKRVNKPMKGHFAKAHIKPVRFIRELRVANPDEYQVGQEIKADIFDAGEYVDVTGISKGKGFAGTIKRHGFNRGPMAHGSKSHRMPGSIGIRMSGGGGKVFKGKRLPGQMGRARVTVQDLEVVKVNPDLNLMLIKGAIPGPKGGLVMIRSTVKR